MLGRKILMIGNAAGQMFSDGKKMTTERRRFIRPESFNLLDYLVVDNEDGQHGEYAMGRTLNVSRGGILMETHIPLQVGWQVMITIGLEDNLVDIMGRVVYTTNDGSMYQNGIEFFHVAETDRLIIERYMKAFHSKYQEEITPGLEEI